MYTYSAKVINVVDGDTIDAMVDVGFKIHTIQRFRLNRIDTEEMHDADIIKRNLAIEAKEFLKSTLLDKDIIIQTKKSDAFGRWLAEVILDNINVNDILLEKKLATIWKKS